MVPIHDSVLAINLHVNSTTLSLHGPQNRVLCILYTDTPSTTNNTGTDPPTTLKQHLLISKTLFQKVDLYYHYTMSKNHVSAVNMHMYTTLIIYNVLL